MQSKAKVKPDAVAKQPASRAQRKAQHVEANRALWDSAENPETFHYVDAKNDVPLKSEFKPAMKVLSRKPKAADQPKIATRPRDAQITNGITNLTLNEEEDIDSEEEERREKDRSMKERQEKARIEREEKQKKYKEVRDRLFGSTEQSKPGTSSPTRPSSSSNGQRGAKSGRKGALFANTPQPATSTDQSPSRESGRNSNGLYDPGYSAEPGSVFLQAREQVSRQPQVESPHIRAPKRPDGSGRGGFGFTTREGKAS